MSSPLDELLNQAKKELSGDTRLINAKMQAITNGYSIASSFSTAAHASFGEAGSEMIAEFIISLARKTTEAIYEDYKQALEMGKEPVNEYKN